MSDRVKIPFRGKSASSYGKEEFAHNQTLQELDSLFPGANESTNSKNRGSSTSPKKISLLDFDDLDDVVSLRVPETGTKEEDLTGYERMKKEVVAGKVGEAVEVAINSRKKKNKKKPETVLTVGPVVISTPTPTPEEEVKEF